MTNTPSSAVIRDIWMNGLGLCFATWVWVEMTRWGNSESVFFGVRTVKNFEETAEAHEIDSRYVREIVALTGTLILLYAALQWFFRPLLPSVRPYEFLSLEVLQAIGVRTAYWTARNRTLQFAAPVDAVRIADLASLASPSRTWNLLYWPSVFLPLVAAASCRSICGFTGLCFRTLSLFRSLRIHPRLHGHMELSSRMFGY